MKIQIRVLLSLMGVALLAASLYNELTALAAGTIRGVSLAGLSIAILALVLGGCVGLYFTRASAQLAQAAAQFAGGDTDLARPSASSRARSNNVP